MKYLFETAVLGIGLLFIIYVIAAIMARIGWMLQ